MGDLERAATSLRESQTVRLLVVGALVLLLLIPVAMISHLIEERQQRRESAVAEVSSSWGGEQAITGPALVVPFTRRWTERGADGETVVRESERTAVFLPERLEVRGGMASETLRRGIFAVPVYRLRAVVEGEFARPDVGALGADVAAVHWERARLVVGISDARAIQEASAVTWNGRESPFRPGTAGFGEGLGGIHAAVAVPAGGEGAERLSFSFPVALNGSRSLRVAPFGQVTVVELESDFPAPSFQGAWLPTERSVTEEGFRARWSVPFLGRNYPQAWVAGEGVAPESRAGIGPASRAGGAAAEGAGAGASPVIEASRFGVELVSPVDHYRMAQRSVKYAVMFLFLTFAAVWLMEVLAGVRVHPIQYLLLGAALCVFYLLELSLSEHLGFPVAYGLASLAVIGMVAAYSRAVLRRGARAAVVGSGVAALYVYLYILLMNEDFALLIGSVGLFLILGGIMYATRGVDWFAVGRRPQGAGG